MSTQHNQNNPNLLNKIRAILKNHATGMLITQLNGVHPSVCPMTAKTLDDTGAIWFLSTKESEHYNNIQVNNNVLITFNNPTNKLYISISGKAKHTKNPEKIDAIWETGDAQWYPNGREDKNVVALCIEIEKTVYWDSHEQKSKSFG